MHFILSGPHIYLHICNHIWCRKFLNALYPLQKNWNFSGNSSNLVALPVPKSEDINSGKHPSHIFAFLFFLACARKVKRIVSVKYFTAAVWRGHKMSLQDCTINLLVEWNGHRRITFVHLGNLTANLEWDDIFLTLTWRSYSLCSWQALHYCGGCLTFPGGKRRRRHSRHREKWSCIWLKRERWIQETIANPLKQLATWRW